MNLIEILQKRCDIYSDLLDKFASINIEVVSETNDQNVKMKLSKLLYDIRSQVQELNELIENQDKLMLNK